ncbi:hypothetical protein WJX72_003302 [[Myrmecia] bisecta]
MEACSSSASSTTSLLSAQKQQRGMKVIVQNNNVDRAMGQLNRKLRAEGILQKWKEQSVYLKPATRRVLAQKETEHRLKKQRFRELMSWVLKRKARGF